MCRKLASHEDLLDVQQIEEDHGKSFSKRPESSGHRRGISSRNGFQRHRHVPVCPCGYTEQDALRHRIRKLLKGIPCLLELLAGLIA